MIVHSFHKWFSLMIFKHTRTYSLRTSRQILKNSYSWYKKKYTQFNAEVTRSWEELLDKLDKAILRKDRSEAHSLARQAEQFNSTHFKKSIFSYLIETIIAIVVALVVATVIRQVWFELYEIPTGSMRPTFREQDNLTVTKTAFGINVPLQTEHFYFDPHLVQRASVFIWSGDGIAHLNSDSTFMWIFPYTKRYIKRCMGKPGDTLYFYGGKIYGYDQEGNDLVELRDNPWLTHIEHIPFTNFEGRRSYTNTGGLRSVPEAIFHHFNKGIGRLRFFKDKIEGEIFDGKEWIKDNPVAQSHPHTTIQTYSDFWGIKNFAIARILNKEQLQSITPYVPDELPEGILYLELRHTPSLTAPSPLLSERMGVTIKGFSTVIPLQEKHLHALMNHMYTCRFVVRDGQVSAYREGGTKFYPTSPTLDHLSDGTYEFYFGKAYQIGWGGIASLLPPDHPIYEFDPTYIQKLFNIGIEMNTQVEPHSRNQPFFPSRYIYFRDGDLYALGGLLMEKADPILIDFLSNEQKKEEKSTAKNPYVAFKDSGPPITPEGQLDKNFIKTFGLYIPEKHYLALGDNHAMSQDSRYFGPIPEANLQGAPSLIIWPPGPRWGIPNQKPYPLLTFPRLMIWGTAAIIALIWFLFHRYSLKKPIFTKLSKK